MNNDLRRIASSKELSEWKTINDTIMGGSSEATCQITPDGLLLKGILIEENGGFVSCTSPFLSPALDLSEFHGIQLDVDGEGRTLKFAISCGDGFNRFSKFVGGGVRWVVEIQTKELGITSVKIPFKDFRPTIRAKPIPIPLKFSPFSIVQLQLLHSKFGTAGNLNSGFKAGNLNSGFKAGPFQILLCSISAYI